MQYPRLIIPAFAHVYRTLGPITEPLIRVVAGVSLAAHGYPTLFVNPEGAADFMADAGIEPAMMWAMIVGVVEFVGGLCLALGLLTRVVAVPILIFLAAAVVYHWQFGFYWHVRGFEYPLFWAVVVFHFLMWGGGRWSVDNLIGREF